MLDGLDFLCTSQNVDSSNNEQCAVEYDYIAVNIQLEYDSKSISFTSLEMLEYRQLTNLIDNFFVSNSMICLILAVQRWPKIAQTFYRI